VRFSTDAIIRQNLAKGIAEAYCSDKDRGISTLADTSSENVEKCVREYTFSLFNEPHRDFGPIISQASDMVLMTVKAVSADDSAEIQEALSRFKIEPNRGKPKPKLVFYRKEPDGKSSLYLRVPDCRDQSEEVKGALANYINFARTLTNTDLSRIRLVYDPALGQGCPVSRTTEAAIRNALANMKSMSGDTGLRLVSHTIRPKTAKVGDKSEIPAKVVRASGVGYLTLLRTLHNYGDFYIKKDPLALTKQNCMEIVDKEFGLREDNIQPWHRDFMRQVLNVSVTECETFPSAFYKHVKALNDAKTSEQLMRAMGYQEIAPTPNEIVHVCTANAERSKDGKKVIKLALLEKKTGTRKTRNSVFEMGVKLTLPLLALDAQRGSLRDQLKKNKELLSVTSRAFFLRHRKEVESFKKAYAFLMASLSGTNKKALPAHFVAAVGQTRNIFSKNVNYTDAIGNTYDDYMQIPLPMRRCIEDFLFREYSLDRKLSTSEESNLKRKVSENSPMGEKSEEGPPRKDSREESMTTVVATADAVATMEIDSSEVGNTTSALPKEIAPSNWSVERPPSSRLARVAFSEDTAIGRKAAVSEEGEHASLVGDASKGKPARGGGKRSSKRNPPKGPSIS